LLAGSAGTAVLSVCYVVADRVRSGSGPADYDDSLVPGKIVAGILHLPSVTDHEDEELGLALRWSYGSGFGIFHGLLRRRMAEPQASLVFGATLMTLTCTMFPLLGRTPPPWRWPRGFLATSVATHAAYVVAVAAVDSAAAEGGRAEAG
jgi:hypothetical protein